MRRFSILIALAVVLAAAFGCEQTGNDPLDVSSEADQQAAAIDFDDPVGGLTEADELPAFDEPQLYEAIQEGDEPYDDPIRLRAGVREMERMHGSRIFRIRALWGRMTAAIIDTLADECCVVDWSGGMRAEGGAIVIERLIRFDPADSMTRRDRSDIEWVSHTCPGVDGVQVRIIFPPVPPDSASTNPVEPSLTIRTGPFERTFTLEELEALDLMEPVDRCDNYMSIASHEVIPACPHGFLMGKWNRLQVPDTIPDPQTGETRGVVLGYFRGLWVSETGWASGQVRGFYGTDQSGERKFFGKYIGMDGRFRGILRGFYGPDADVGENAAGKGWLKGEWLGGNRIVRGHLEGEWITAAYGQGYFKGIWGMPCGAER